jgi:hemoglobin-like flavoprotein
VIAVDQIIDLVIQGKNETEGMYASLLSDQQKVRELFNVSADERKAKLEEWAKGETAAAAAVMKTTEAVTHGAGAVREGAEGWSKATVEISHFLGVSEHTTESLLKMGSSPAASIAAIGVLAAVAAEAAKGLFELVMAGGEWAKETQRDATVMGVSVEQVQKYKLAVAESGVSFAQLSTSASMLERKLGEDAEAFARMGFSVEKLKEMDPGQLLQTILEHVAGLGSQYEKTAALAELFGRGGARAMLPIIEHLKDLNENAEKFNTVVGKDSVAALKQVDEASVHLNASWEALKHNFAAALAPDLTRWLDTVAAAIASLGKTINEHKDTIAIFFRVAFAPLGVSPGASGASPKPPPLDPDLGYIPGIGFASKREYDAMVKAGADFLKRTDAEAKAAAKAATENLKMEARARQQIEDQEHAERIRALNQFIKVFGDESKKQTEIELAGIKDRMEGLRREEHFRQEVAAEVARINADSVRLGVDAEKALESARAQGNVSLDAEIAKVRASTNAHVEELTARKAKLEVQMQQPNLSKDVQRALQGEVAEVEKAIAAYKKAGETSKQFLTRMRKVRDLQNFATALSGIDTVLGQIGISAESDTRILINMFAQMAAAAAQIASGDVVGGAVHGITAFIGGILGLGSGAEKARQELEKLKAEAIRSAGSLDELKHAAGEAGWAIDRAFASQSVQEFNGWMQVANDIMAQHKKTVEGLHTAMGGLDLMVKGFTEHMQKSGLSIDDVNGRLRNYEQRLKAAGLSIDEINKKLDEKRQHLERIVVVTEEDQAAFDRLGKYAASMFAQLVRETGDFLGALAAIGPTLDELQHLQEQYGFTVSASLAKLLGVKDVVVANKDLFDSLSGLNQMMKGLGDNMMFTLGLANDFGLDATDIFNKLKDRVGDGTQAMALMQPTLQQLWEHQQKFHDITDEATLSLLHEAETAGLVGDQFKSTMDKVLDVLLAIAQVLGATIPKYLRDLDGKKATINVHTNYTSSGTPPPDDQPPRDRGFAAGGFVPAVPGGVRALLGEGGEGEWVVPQSQARSFAQRMIGSDGAAMPSVVLNVHNTVNVNGTGNDREIGRSVAAQMRNHAGELHRIFSQEMARIARRL